MTLLCDGMAIMSANQVRTLKNRNLFFIFIHRFYFEYSSLMFRMFVWKFIGYL